VEPADRIGAAARPAAAHVVRPGSTFYQRVRRKLRLADSAEIALGLAIPGAGHDPDDWPNGTRHRRPRSASGGRRPRVLAVPWATCARSRCDRGAGGSGNCLPDLGGTARRSACSAEAKKPSAGRVQVSS